MNEVVNLPVIDNVTYQLNDTLLEENVLLRKELSKLINKINILKRMKSIEKKLNSTPEDSIEAKHSNINKELLIDLSKNITLEKTIKSDKKVSLSNLKSSHTSYRLSEAKGDPLDNRMRQYADIFLASLKNDPIMNR